MAQSRIRFRAPKEGDAATLGDARIVTAPAGISRTHVALILLNDARRYKEPDEDRAALYRAAIKELMPANADMSTHPLGFRFRLMHPIRGTLLVSALEEYGRAMNDLIRHNDLTREEIYEAVGNRLAAEKQARVLRLVKRNG